MRASVILIAMLGSCCDANQYSDAKTLSTITRECEDRGGTLYVTWDRISDFQDLWLPKSVECWEAE